MSPDRFNKWRLSCNLASQTYLILIVRVRGLRAPQHLFNSTDSVSVPFNPRRQTCTSKIGRCPTLPLPFPNLISFQGKNWFAFVWLTEAILILTEALRWFHGSCSSSRRAGKWHSMGVRRAPDYKSSGIWYSFILAHFSPTAAGTKMLFLTFYSLKTWRQNVGFSAYIFQIYFLKYDFLKSYSCWSMHIFSKNMHNLESIYLLFVPRSNFFFFLERLTLIPSAI